MAGAKPLATATLLRSLARWSGLRASAMSRRRTTAPPAQLLRFGTPPPQRSLRGVAVARFLLTANFRSGALVVAIAIIACKREPQPETKRDAGVASSVRVDAATKPDLPGTIWFVDIVDSMSRISGGNRTGIVSKVPLFPSRFALPDGRLVAIASRRDGSAESEQLVLVATDGTVTHIGPTGAMIRDPAVDRAGAWITFAANLGGHSDLYRLDLATQKTERLTNNREGNFSPAALGAGVVFASSRDGNSEIYRLPEATTKAKPQRLTAFHKDDWGPTVSPDGTIAFLSDREGPVRIFLMAADGRQQRRLTARPRDHGDEAEPVWSADGKQLAYIVEERCVSTPCARTVIVRDVLTSAERIHSPSGARDAEPSFSPDGAWLVLSRESSNSSSKTSVLWAIRIADGYTVELANGRLPRWL